MSVYDGAMHFRLLTSILLSTLVVGGSAFAQMALMDGVYLPPLGDGWSLIDTPPRNGVASITETFQNAGGAGMQLGTPQVRLFRLSYDNAGHLRTLVQSREGQKAPDCTDSFDTAGHRISHLVNTTNGKGRRGIGKTLATYDSHGQLVRYSITDVEGKTTIVPVTTTSNATGTTCVWPSTWVHNTPVTCEARYDLSGRLVETTTDFTQSHSTTRLQYNEQGDVISTTGFFGRPTEWYEFEYRYDAHQNWTEMKRYRTLMNEPQAKRQLWSVHSRKIVYGKPTQIAELPAAASTPATTHPTPSTRSISPVDVYVMTRGNSNDPNDFWTVETLTLIDQNRFLLDNTMPVIGQPGHTTNVLSQGHYTQSGQTLTLTIEQINAKPATEEATQHPLVLQRSTDGQTLTSPHDPPFEKKGSKDN